MAIVDKQLAGMPIGQLDDKGLIELRKQETSTNSDIYTVQEWVDSGEMTSGLMPITVFKEWVNSGFDSLLMWGDLSYLDDCNLYSKRPEPGFSRGDAGERVAIYLAEHIDPGAVTEEYQDAYENLMQRWS